MHKTWLVISREYLSRVRKKSFIVITLLIPLLVAGMLGLEIFLAMGGNKETLHIAVVDRSGLFGSELTDGEEVFFTSVHGQDTVGLASRYRQKGYDGLLVIPELDIRDPKGFVYEAPHQLGLGPYMYITGQLNKVIEKKRMLAAGIDQEQLDRIKAHVDLIQPSAGQPHQGNRSLATKAATAAGYVLGLLIYMILMIYGMQVMRGVAEEKVNRIAEVLASSVRPFQMMIGKVVGIAGVGLTQFLIWIGLFVATFAALAPLLKGALHAGAAHGAAGTIAALVSTLPLAKLLICFVFYFLGGYLLYAALFAAVGAAVDQDMTESQALTLPITLPLVISFFIMFNTIQQPNSPLSVFASIFPLSAPLVMIARIPFGVPGWQLALSLLLLLAAVIVVIWIAGRVYRTGILLYGKKITIRELARWAFRKG